MNKTILSVMLTSALVGCGSSDEKHSTSPSPSPTPSPTIVTGVAATGAPIYGEITVLDTNGTTQEYAAVEGGNFEFEKSSITAPAIVKAVGSAGGGSHEIYSLILTNHQEIGVSNITPFTHMLISKMTGKPADEVYSDFNTYKADLTIEALQSAQQELKQVLKPLLNGANIADDFDLVSSEFEANYQDIDAILDLVDITISDIGATLTYKGDTDYSVTLAWNESWSNKSFHNGAVELGPEDVKEPLTYIVAADSILESMVMQETKDEYLKYVHEDAFWFGQPKEGMFEQLKSMLPNETDPMNRYRDFVIQEVADDDSYQLAYTECYQDSPFATCGRAKAWFAKNSDGQIKFMGRKDKLPVSVSAIIKAGFFNSQDRTQGNWAIEIDAFPDANTICGKIPSNYDNTSWFAGIPKLAKISDYMELETVTVAGDGIDGNINLDSIYKEVTDGKITGCHLVDSNYGYEQQWDGQFMPYSLVIDGYQVDANSVINDNAKYEVTYQYKDGSPDTNEQISIGKGKQSSDDMSKYIAELVDSRGSNGDFYMNWTRESKLATDIDVWVQEVGQPGTQRVAVPDGKTSVSATTFNEIERATLVTFDEYGRSISVGYAFEE
ncbi:hypothetical protein [Vibrio crassostreae]|uniref:hypothetical protein n=1 Tax=Vibrio crassostreae TaxID=246167 RepID=UPI00062FE7E3|nr:hypothetical protein [Vibrio crassostreae]CAK2053343.1 Lipoprotein [Vibrio crassostreae]CAK2066431.1 Lipoprotein [Vibrio crassostreae]CAK2067704.1 Lipoprotein [Vibrio crassostreae]CAK2070245.1 Lipoprotein [Vibrio crassostreae]CAK2499190.1 Lipoprotein [Vibrio crassostreae]